jgi:LemA protein
MRIRLLALFSFLSVLFLSSCGYNSMIASDENVKTAWAQVQNQLQRRYDLIPNLVETVKGQATNEKSTLVAVTEARAKMGGVINLPVDAVNDPVVMKRYQDAQNSLGGALQRLMTVNESYPQLQANQAFQDLRAQLEGTENRLSVERMRYNEAVRLHNTLVRSFPNNITANMFHFKTAIPFEITSEAVKEAPKVKF